PPIWPRRFSPPVAHWKASASRLPSYSRTWRVSSRSLSSSTPRSYTTSSTAASRALPPRCTPSRARSTNTQATGVLALFGAPLAHEDSPRRAVHAALGIQRVIRDVAQALQAERGLSLQMRMGINTGLVVVGKIGDDLRMDYTAVGDTTNLAARLQQMAQPGSVVISARTQQHGE